MLRIDTHLLVLVEPAAQHIHREVVVAWFLGVVALVDPVRDGAALRVKLLPGALIQRVPLRQQVLADRGSRNLAQRQLATETYERAEVGHAAALQLVAQEIALQTTDTL